LSSDDVDSDALISRLAGPLEPDARAAFRKACEAAIADVACPGPGTLYRIVSQLQRGYFDPPPDARVTRPIDHGRTSKLRAAPPLALGRDRRYTRRQLQVTG
jgi:hypothetical protein